MHIWPETGTSGDTVGLYVEVANLTSGALELSSFEGTLCAVGLPPPDAGVPDAMPDAAAPSDAGVVDAGVSPDAAVPDAGMRDGCGETVRYPIERAPQRFVAVFTWASGSSSAVITATAFDSGSRAVTSVFRRVTKGDGTDGVADAGTADAGTLPDAGGLDAGLADAGTTGDAQ